MGDRGVDRGFYGVGWEFVGFGGNVVIVEIVLKDKIVLQFEWFPVQSDPYPHNQSS